jgi:hypothetical protein
MSSLPERTSLFPTLIVVPARDAAGVQKRSAKRVAFAGSKSCAFGLQALLAETLIKAVPATKTCAFSRDAIS